jgi:hypothetical protein
LLPERPDPLIPESRPLPDWLSLVVLDPRPPLDPLLPLDPLPPTLLALRLPLDGCPDGAPKPLPCVSSVRCDPLPCKPPL